MPNASSAEGCPRQPCTAVSDRRVWQNQSAAAHPVVGGQGSATRHTAIIESKLTGIMKSASLGETVGRITRQLPSCHEAFTLNKKRRSHDAAAVAAYSKVVLDYVAKGYVREVPAEELKPGQQWFLPRFAVLRPDKATMKTRFVFDASAKCDSITLNDTILPGPKLQHQLLSVLTNFCQKPVALICDIAEMYLRIGLSADDRPYHRFLWRGMDETAPPRVYEFQRLVFGANASPFIA